MSKYVVLFCVTASTSVQQDSRLNRIWRSHNMEFLGSTSDRKISAKRYLWERSQVLCCCPVSQQALARVLTCPMATMFFVPEDVWNALQGVVTTDCPAVLESGCIAVFSVNHKENPQLLFPRGAPATKSSLLLHVAHPSMFPSWED